MQLITHCGFFLENPPPAPPYEGRGASSGVLEIRLVGGPSFLTAKKDRLLVKSTSFVVRNDDAPRTQTTSADCGWQSAPFASPSLQREGKRTSSDNRLLTDQPASKRLTLGNPSQATIGAQTGDEDTSLYLDSVPRRWHTST